MFEIINENGVWRTRTNNELRELFKESNLGKIIRLRSLKLVRHM